ncbi:hypothetical protein [Ferrimonas marina]|uniref:Quorum-sensing-regulated virulence factor n=1 Tax=Ferrimonas marina TaxID=299255 RepID=A0A1M5MTB7_9GAMM|nr:hypothetical protein [Ferrimonas marina]SHG80538.1 hypothetical protein SAMN02745129_0771 [Ferrimonas marina]
MKGYVAGVVLAVAPLVASAGQTPFERELSVALSQSVVEMNAGLPMELDEETRLDSVTTVRNLMVYNNTLVNYSADELDVDRLEEALAETVIGPLCSNAGLNTFVDLGVEMVYRYFGKDGVFVTELSKDMATCRKP